MIEWKKKAFYFRFDEKNGCIDSLQDGRKEYIGEKIPVFKLRVIDKNGEQKEIEKEALPFIRCEKEENSFTSVYGNKQMDVTVYARIAKAAGEIQWKVTVDMKDDSVAEWVDFPRIAVPNDLKDHGGKSKILWGFNEGGIVDDLDYKENGDARYMDLQYPSFSNQKIYPGIMESQILAYYDDKSGLYLGAHDKEDNIKGIDFYRAGNGILLQFRHMTGSDFGCRYEMPFFMVMKFFQGDWQNAADIYRDWMKAERKGWMLPITENKNLPDWYGESPVIITYPVRGKHDTDVMEPNKMYPYIEAMKHVERLEKELDSKIMVILMHWEGTAPWAPPYVWPPYGGEAELKKFIDALHERGDVLGVYCSGMDWTQRSKLVDDYSREQEFEEKHLEKVMCVSPKQELPYCNIVPFIRSGYDMCPSQKFTVDVMKDQVRHMVDAGIDYIQLLDQNQGGSSYFCYSRHHGHAPVPGKWQVEAVQNLLEKSEENTGKVLFGCESAAAEGYIPWLLFSDNRYHLNYAAGMPVPLYAYLYHEYVNNFMGNQVCANFWLDHEKSPENVLERMAYSFMAGDMLTLILNENGDATWNWGWRKLEDIPDQENILTFVRNANRWRRGMGKKYLHSGKMVKPYPVLSEKVIFHGYHEHVFETEQVHTCAWTSQDGGYGQFLINCHPENVECEICLPEGNYRLYENEEHDQKLSGGQQKIVLKPLSVVCVETYGANVENE